MWYVHYYRSYPGDLNAEIELRFFDTEAKANAYIKRLELALVKVWNQGLVEDFGKEDAPVMTVDDLNTDPFFVNVYDIHKGVVTAGLKVNIH